MRKYTYRTQQEILAAMESRRQFAEMAVPGMVQ